MDLLLQLAYLMTFKMEKDSDGDATVIRVIGRIESTVLAELGTHIKTNGSRLCLDLEEVTLVDVEVVQFIRQEHAPQR
jgi:hypothetical protein